MTRIQISQDSSGRIIAFFPYKSLVFSKVKTIEDHRRRLADKPWSLLTTPILAPVGEGRGEEVGIGLSLKFNVSSKTTGIFTRVSTKNLGKIRSPIDNLNLEGSEIHKT